MAELKAYKVSTREVRLTFKENYAMWPEAFGRFVIKIVSSGNYYYGSTWDYKIGVLFSQNFRFADSVASWVQWWVWIRRKSDNYDYATIRGPDFYVPM